MTDLTDGARRELGQSAASTPAPRFGLFTYDVATGRLSWSDKMYGIFGLAASEVVPSFAVMSSHQHPDDRAAWDAGVARSLTGGVPFCRWHRIVDTKQRVHSALSVAYCTVGESGAVAQFSGFVVDLTRTLRRERDAEATRAVLQSAATRDVIEQAKGMVMVIFDLTDSQAFDLLRWHSSYSNIKVREVAATLVNRLVDPELAGLAPRQRLTAILSGLKSSTPVSVRATRTAPQAAPADAKPIEPSTARISAVDLPRTMVRAVSVAAQSISIADWQAPDKPLVYVNAAFETLTGYSETEIYGRNCRFLQGPDTDPRTVAEMSRALSAGREIRTVVRNYRRDGRPFWNEVHLSAVRDDAGRITHYIGYQSDVSERVEREQQLVHLAHHDARTGLPNQPAALADLAKAVSGGADRTGFGVLSVAVRAVAGTDQEDIGSLLSAAADRFQEVLPVGSALSVLQDDSFLVRLPQAVVDPSELVLGTLRDPLTVAGADVKVSVRIGRVDFPADGSDPAALIAAAQQHRD